MKCINCGKEFTPKRKTAKYCSADCRKLAFQNKNANDKKSENRTLKSENRTLTHQKTPKSTNSDTLSQKQNSSTKGFRQHYARGGDQRVCHGCGEPVGEFTCICYKCIAKGHIHKSLNATDCPDYIEGQRTQGGYLAIPAVKNS